ncbi:asparagine synthase-related protein [Fretibacter rubidus]|uniref:asparagine synthase-related protein n=1 Tax=Fretibacter rubidus TaxID=570162 RepID=UPI00352B6944
MFAAIIMRGSRENPKQYVTGETFIESLTPFTKADVSGIWQDDRAIIAQATHHNTPESIYENAPEVCEDTGCVIASWIRLDNRAKLCAALGLTERPTLTDPHIVLAAYRQWGRDCTNELEGDFSFIIYDPKTHATFCARDTMGAKPFFYQLTDRHLIVATSVAAIRAVKGLTLIPNVEWTALFLANLNFAHRQSAYEGVEKLPPSHDMFVDINTAQGPREYFTFDLTAPHSVKRDNIWVDRYREAFDKAVYVRSRSANLIGAESSAGLDSSSIIATLVDKLPHSRDDFHTFGLCATEDEPGLLLSTAAHCGVRHTHTLMTPKMLQIDESFHRALTSLGHPPEHWQMLYQPSFFEQSQRFGIKTLVSGYGGDEVVTNYAKYLPRELLLRKAYVAALNEMSGSLPMRLARFGKAVTAGSSDPHISLRAIIKNKFALSCIHQDVLENSKLRQRVEDTSFPRQSEWTLNTIAANAPGFRLARSGRLESEAIFAASYGMQYRYPMYDRRLLQQYFATPSIEKRRRHMGRYLHRRALQGRVPDRILWQPTKFMGAYLGGRMNAQTHDPTAFYELPELLRTIIDEKAYRQQQTAQRNVSDNADKDAVRRNIFFFQLKQLSAWLNEDNTS